MDRDEAQSRRAYTRKKAAASRREKLYEVEIRGETQVANGSQLAGLRAAVARRAKQATSGKQA